LAPGGGVLDATLQRPDSARKALLNKMEVEHDGHYFGVSD
jgi:hypothetical protein